MKISNSKKELAKIISENGGWRDGAEWAIQHGNDRVSFSRWKGKPSWDMMTKCWRGCIFFDGFSHPKIANYHQTALSREEYLHLYQVTDADGWIEWKGGECPVEFGTLIDVKYRDYHIQLGCRAFSLCDSELYATTHWRSSGSAADIIAYRLHKPEQAGPEHKDCVNPTYTANVEVAPKPTIERLAADYRNKLYYAKRKKREADKAKIESDAALSELENAAAAIGFAITPIGELTKYSTKMKLVEGKG